MKITIELTAPGDIYRLREWLAGTAGDPLSAQTPIDALGVTMRSCNCLKAENIGTIEALLQWTEAQLLATPNMGRKTTTEIKNALLLRGLHLKDAS